MEKSERLTLVDAEQITFNDKETGTPVKMWKYTFLNPANELVEGFLDTPDYKDLVVKGGKYQDDKAKDFLFTGKTFAGKIKWRLKPIK